MMASAHRVDERLQLGLELEKLSLRMVRREVHVVVVEIPAIGAGGELNPAILRCRVDVPVFRHLDPP